MTFDDRVTIVISTLLRQGLPMTLKLIGASLFFALLIGLVFGTLRYFKVPILDQVLGFYGSFFRGVPTIIILLFFYAYLTQGTQFWIAILAISLVEGAYMMEIVKGGFLAVDKGQWEAANSLGIPKLVIITRIILPQVLLVAVPALIGQTVMLIKGTTVAATIGCMDVLRRAQLLLPKYSYPLEIYLYVLIIFFIMNHFIAMLGKNIEQSVVTKIIGDQNA